MKIDLKISNQLLTRVGSIERIVGRLEHLSESATITPPESQLSSLFVANAIGLIFEGREPAPIEKLFKTDPETGGISLEDTGSEESKYMRAAFGQIDAALLNVHKNARLGLEEILELQRAIVTASPTLRTINGQDSTTLRTTPYILTSPARLTGGPAGSESPLFPTVPGYLVERRLTEVLQWLDEASNDESLHPLLLTAIFQISLLQISPFPVGNHCLALLLCESLLLERGYSFLTRSPLAWAHLHGSKQYLNALRQAEKTVNGTWASINIWLDYFLGAVISCANSAVLQAEGRLDARRLSGLQRQIIEVIRDEGISSRERIAEQTGISASTIKYNLSVLTDRGIISRLGAGRTTSYRLI